ncbi:MAG: biotin/lipoyl-binding protein [Desulfobacterales bacterium]|nr:biotin/lipoyl-binding protein [Desulfobacterales bacterium]
MKCYRIKVEGKTYDVEIEELQGAAAGNEPAQPVPARTSPAPAAPAPATPAPATPPPAAAAPAPKPAAVGAGVVTAPMGGKITSLRVKKGDRVAVEDVLLTLEAMKLENEIRAQQDGTVTDIQISEMATVDAGDVLLTIG